MSPPRRRVRASAADCGSTPSHSVRASGSGLSSATSFERNIRARRFYEARLRGRETDGTQSSFLGATDGLAGFPDQYLVISHRQAKRPVLSPSLPGLLLFFRAGAGED